MWNTDTLRKNIGRKAYKNLRMNAEETEENKDKRQMIQSTNMCRLLIASPVCGASWLWSACIKMTAKGQPCFPPCTGTHEVLPAAAYILRGLCLSDSEAASAKPSHQAPSPTSDGCIHNSLPLWFHGLPQIDHSMWSCVSLRHFRDLFWLFTGSEFCIAKGRKSMSRASSKGQVISSWAIPRPRGKMEYHQQ